ncbi:MULTISPECIES: Uma2 family endonuclease [Calothrix]|uniref:Uma2 family endonuclease n=2 Tax=Calothrix TaxID=1186 RepID=A0ABR8A5X3_9CYAN|nr:MULTISPECIES: Uma2 family endonuclease [Calothrix]MBD2195249.1 Uma2 family endonuclease [Calothrix parietina FACHB-288]MBD2223780.1 Uma2 family endonuclease [Calothrix anomala FACHB-343]
MVNYQRDRVLPTSTELPCSDDTPVDNEDQNFIPNLLLFLLESIWAQRNDWFFGVDMGIYHTTGVSHLVPVVPDGFLSLGVERRKADKSRLSYVVWEEQNIVPKFVLEVVSKTPGDEYDTKLNIYAQLGVLYYLIYNPQYWRRDQHQPFELYKLINGEYQLQIGEPFWMPEINLGIGRSRYTSGTIQREVLYWYDETGTRYPTADEIAQAERQKTEKLAAKLRELGIDPDNI